MAELLLELLSEEIPARMQARTADDLKRLVSEVLKKAGLEFETAEAYATPRRLALVVDGLPTAQPDISEERKGPKADAPDQAIAGFLKSVGLTRDQVEERESPKGTVLFAVIEKKGAATADVLADLLPEAVAKLPWPKSMRWGDRPDRWVRPLHGVLCLFDGALVSFAYNHLESRDTTAGHRFMAPDAITVAGFADYQDKLRHAYVMLDAAERRTVIEKDAAVAAEGEGFSLKPDPGLVDEVAGLVEWPVVLTGAIDPDFMDLPAEVLTTSMRHHLKHLALLDSDGNLAPRFVVVANNHATDGGKQIVAGNERVLRARLSDAKFFWDQDRKHTLESRIPELDKVVFHAKLDSVGEKVKRIEALAVEIAKSIPGAEEAAVREGARLCKADLVSGMVIEFPELQGVMGRYYALAEGKDAAVSDAIAEHYSPQGPNDDCPSAPASIAVALADKIDSLAGFWAIDEKPTGSKDPFALRRAALGAIRLIVENNLRVSLVNVFYDALRSYAVAMVEADKPPQIDANDILEFFADRLKVHLREKGVRHDLISAVFALGGEDDLVRLLARVEALQAFVDSDDGEHLLTAYKRAANIVGIEEKKDGASYYDAEVDAALLSEVDEIAVAERLTEVGGLANAALANEEFAAAMSALALLRKPVDSFFDNVTVNCDDADLRRNRLSLLAGIRATLDRVADFSKIEG
ncbi:MAG: glycine--tRNA ligase subunit beta [Pseudomonadota bacterium]|nr:glycine--tRNA ligase subunit beta [Pseudomonadota bacterium]